MDGYYSEKLAGERLLRCYEIAPPRVQQYLYKELDFAAQKISSGDLVLELGCGYGRAVPDLARRAGFVVGIDISQSSLSLAKERLRGLANCYLLHMDAAAIRFLDGFFDLVVCLQNGISAFQIDRKLLLAETLRVTRPGGTILFSTYSEKFWKHRLDWFERQAEEGLIGEIDRALTGDGRIFCKDGFVASTVGAEEFLELAASLGVEARIAEVDESSLFCEIRKPEAATGSAK